MLPVLFRLGPITVYSFGAMMAIALLFGGYLTGKEMDRKGLPGQLASNIVFWTAIGAVAGGRLWVIAEDWRGFLHDPVGMVFSGSGFAFYGGFLGALALVSALLRYHDLPWLRVADCIAPAAAIGHAIGRVGCQLAGDGDWGVPSRLPWAMAYPNAIVGWEQWLRQNHLPADTVVHPTPVYESIAYTLVFAVLWSMRTRSRPDGRLFWWYLLLAPGARFLIEFARHNPRHVIGLSIAQFFSLLLIAVAVWHLAIGHARTVTAPSSAKP